MQLLHFSDTYVYTTEPGRWLRIWWETHSARSAVRLETLNDHSGSGTTTVADGGDTLLSGLEGVDEGDDDTGAGASDGVAEGDGTTADVDLGAVEAEDLLGGNGDDGEGLVELPEGDVLLGDAGVLEGDGDGEGGGGGEVDGGSGGVSVAEDLGEGLEAVLLDSLARGEDDGGGTVVDGRGVGGGDSAVLLEDGADATELVLEELGEVLVLVDDNLALAGLDRDGGDLVLEETLLPGLLSALVRAQALVVLHLTGDAELLGGVLGAVAHGELVVDVEESVNNERVLALEVTEAGESARDKEGGVRHRLHTTGNHDVALAELDSLRGHGDRLQAGSTDLVDGCGVTGLGETGSDTDLASRRLAGTGLDDVAHVDLLDLLGGDLGLGESSLDGGSTEVGRGDGLQSAILGADGSALGTDNVDGVSGVGGGLEGVSAARNSDVSHRSRARAR